MKIQTKNLTITALLAAAICVAAPWAIPIGAVPITLGTFIILTAASVAGSKRGTLAVALYVVMGAIGLPVFSGFSGGAGQLLGPTGGFIAGYIPCALVAGLIIDARPASFWIYPAGMAAGMLLCYAFGTAWYAFSTESSLFASLAVCVLPFLVLDALKLAAAATLSFYLRRRLCKAGLI